MLNIDKLDNLTLERFQKKIRKMTEEPQHWLWIGASRGEVKVGNFSHPGGRIESSRRIAYKLWKGPAPADRRVRVSCGHELCVNPDHLYLDHPKSPIRVHEHDKRRFWDKVDKSGGPDACWPWTGGTISVGKTNKSMIYGVFGVGGGGQRAHRVALAIDKNIDITSDILVRHGCNNTLCCNPAHLSVGSHQDNVDDKVSANRCNSVCGESSGMAKLTEEKVRAIRLRRATPHGRRKKLTPYAIIAQESGMALSTVAKICTRQLWAHVV